MVNRDIEPSPSSSDENCSTDIAQKNLIRAWLHGRSVHTQRAYSRDVSSFLEQVNKPLAEVTLADVVGWHDGQSGPATSRNRRLASVKSLISYGARIGFLPVDVAAPLRGTASKDTLHERILTQKQVRAMIGGEPNPRKRACLRVLYKLGLRISEACALTWRDMSRHQSGGTATIFGKGSKTRHVFVPSDVWKELSSIREDMSADAPVLCGSDGGPLSVSAADRIVKRAAKRAGLPPNVSAHWLRHACASHSMDNGAPPHLVQANLGHASLVTTTRYLHARQNDGAANYLPD